MAKAQPMALNRRIRMLNNRWKRNLSVVKESGIERWTYGGAVSESEYGSAPVRVLWLLKDTNKALRKDSLPALLRYLAENESELDTKTYQMWKVVAEATKELTGQRAASLGDALKTISVVNVKKTPGGGAAVHSELQGWADITAGLLREEIATLAPDVVVAGGTIGLVNQCLLSDVAGVCRYADDYCRRIPLRSLCPAVKV